MILSMVNAGKEVTLVNIKGGQGIRSKLFSLGLVPGVNLKVLNSSGTSGPVMVAINDTRLALGQGMATKIIVK